MSRDTTPDAAAVQAGIYRRMSSADKSRLGLELSVTARTIALENIRRRHPEYGQHQAKLALFRLLLGDDLFSRAWPAEPLLPP